MHTVIFYLLVVTSPSGLPADLPRSLDRPYASYGECDHVRQQILQNARRAGNRDVRAQCMPQQRSVPDDEYHHRR